MEMNDKLKQFMDKIKKSEKSATIDLSIGEDLSIAIMNLISIEEHLLFTGNKTGDDKFFELLYEARKMRSDLLKQIVKNPKGELYCTSKHLLAASMRLFEVGTKYQSKGEKKTAYDFFRKSFDLYNLFWGLNLDMVKTDGISKKEIKEDTKEVELKKSDFFGKINGVIGKILDCCRE